MVVCVPLATSVQLVVNGRMKIRVQTAPTSIEQDWKDKMNASLVTLENLAQAKA